MFKYIWGIYHSCYTTRYVCVDTRGSLGFPVSKSCTGFSGRPCLKKKYTPKQCRRTVGTVAAMLLSTHVQIYGYTYTPPRHECPIWKLIQIIILASFLNVASVYHYMQSKVCTLFSILCMKRKKHAWAAIYGSSVDLSILVLKCNCLPVLFIRACPQRSSTALMDGDRANPIDEIEQTRGRAAVEQISVCSRN